MSGGQCGHSEDEELLFLVKKQCKTLLGGKQFRIA